MLLAEVAGAIARRTGAPELGRRALEGLLRFPGLRLVTVDRHLGQEMARLAADLQLRGGGCSVRGRGDPPGPSAGHLEPGAGPPGRVPHPRPHPRVSRAVTSLRPGHPGWEQNCPKVQEAAGKVSVCTAGTEVAEFL